MQDQIYKILSSRSGKPLRQIIRDTKRTDFYLDAQNALEYGLIDAVVAGELPEPKPAPVDAKEAPPAALEAPAHEAEAARERTNGERVANSRPA
jgi:Clp protease